MFFAWTSKKWRKKGSHKLKILQKKIFIWMIFIQKIYHLILTNDIPTAYGSSSNGSWILLNILTFIWRIKYCSWPLTGPLFKQVLSQSILVVTLSRFITFFDIRFNDVLCFEFNLYNFFIDSESLLRIKNNSK